LDSKDNGDEAHAILATILATKCIDAPANLKLLDGAGASEQEGQLLEGITTTPSLEFPLLVVETIRPSESHLGIETEHLSDDDSKDGLERPIERSPKTDVVPKEVESYASDTRSHLNTSIFGKVKSIIRKSSSDQSCASKSSKSVKSVAPDRKEVNSIAVSFQSSSAKCSKGHQIVFESSEAQSIVSHSLAARLALFPPKNFETKLVDSHHSTASKSSKAEPSERKEGDDVHEVSKISKAKSVVSKNIETELIFLWSISYLQKQQG
jgi:hypothetical protein